MYKTIRQTAALGIINEHFLRQMVARGECPGFRSGNRFLVDTEALKRKLSEMSSMEGHANGNT